MKSKHREVRTSCKECVFFKDKECLAGRHEIFNMQGKLVQTRDAPVVQALCNMHRTNAWQVDNPTVEVARAEIEKTFGIVIEFRGNMESLRKTCLCLSDDYYKVQNLQVAINSQNDTDVNSLVHEVNVMREKGINARLVMNTWQALEFERDFNSFNGVSSANYLLQIQDYATFSSKIFKKIDKYINDDLSRILMFEGVGWTCIPTYVANKTYRDYKSYKLMIDAIRQSSREAGMYKVITNDMVK